MSCKVNKPVYISRQSLQQEALPRSRSTHPCPSPRQRTTGPGRAGRHARTRGDIPPAAPTARTACGGRSKGSAGRSACPNPGPRRAEVSEGAVRRIDKSGDLSLQQQTIIMNSGDILDRGPCQVS